MTEVTDTQKLEDAFQKFTKSLTALDDAVALPVLVPRDRAGIIQSFEFCYEMCWKTLKRLLEVLGHETRSARDVFRTAYQLKLIDHEPIWLAMIESRNATSHTYDEDTAIDIIEKIRSTYCAELNAVAQQIRTELSKISPHTAP